MKLYTLIIFTILISFHTVYADDTSPKWGTISQEELSNPYSAHKGYDAVILSSQCKYSVSSLLNTKRVIYFKIKILSKKGLSRGSVTLDNYSFHGLQECTKVKAQSHNLENGQVVTTEIDPKQLFRNKQGRSEETSFAIPNVKVGSVIEYEYTLESYSIYLEPIWHFQSSIPVLRSAFIIDGFHTPAVGYSIILEGAQIINKYPIHNKKQKSWVLTNVPAMPDVPFLPNIHNYYNKLHFKFVTSTPKTWTSIAKNLKGNDYFGHQLKKSKRLKDILSQIIKESDTPIQKVEQIFNYCQQNYEWNGYFEKYFFHDNLKGNLASKEQSSGSINLMLVALLQEADLEAYPMLVSTRRHGKVFKDFMLATQFNHTLATVFVDGKTLLLDAIDPYSTLYTLPVHDLNEHGLLLKNNTAEWLPIQSKAANKGIVSCDINLTAIASPQYKVIQKFTGILNGNVRKQLVKKPVKEFIKSSLEDIEIKVDSIQVSNEKDKSKSLGITSYFQTIDQLDPDDELLYLTPFPIHDYQSNPFVESKRLYPVRLPYPFKNQFVTTITLPKGYQVESLPPAQRLEMPEKIASLNFQTKVTGNRLQFIMIVDVRKSDIHPKHYQALQTFYTKIIDKMNTTIVLKKVSK